MLDASTLWRTPVTMRKVSVDGISFISMLITLPSGKTFRSLMAISRQFNTKIQHARGLKVASKRSEVCMQVYKLLLCDAQITLAPIELEQETASVTDSGEVDRPDKLYDYLLLMLHRFIMGAIENG